MITFNGRLVPKSERGTFDRNYPIRVDVAGDLDGTGEELILSKEEAEGFIAGLVGLLAELEDRENAYVRVRFTGAFDQARTSSSDRLYTYYDPSGELEVGDHVIVPTQFNPEANAVVVELGRGSWQGDASAVTAKIVKERVDL